MLVFWVLLIDLRKGKPAYEIQLNRDLIKNNQLDFSELKGLIIHEMGHVIGIDHTGAGGNKIPGTQYDLEPYNSIMRAGDSSDDVYNSFKYG